jgi:hypothetical protein
MSAEIYNIKLLSGQELVAELVLRQDDKVVLKYPLYIITQVVGEAQPVISLARYCPFSEISEIVLNKSAIAVMTKARDSMKDFYYANLEYIMKFLEEKLDDKLDRATREIYKEMEESEEELPDILSDMIKPDTSKLN